MSLKEKLKGRWEGVKTDWKESKKKDREAKSAFETARHTERVKQAARFGRESEKIKANRRLKELRTPARSIGFQASPIFSGGMFGEPMGLRRPKKKSTHKKRTGALYVDGHRIESRPSHRKKAVHRKKRSNNFMFGDGLF